MRASRDEAGDVRGVDEQQRADVVGDRSERVEVDDAGVRGRAGDDQLRTGLLRERADHVVVEGLRLVVDAVRDELVHPAAEVDRRAVGEVAALVEPHPHHPVARLQHRHERGLVGVRARVRLHVGVLGAEQLAGAVAGELLGLVDDGVAAVVALGRVALGVLVGEDGTLRLEHRRRREVLRRDELDRGVLALDLAADDVGDLGVGL